MTEARSLEILKSLRDGINPFTGETLSIENHFQHPETVRALYKAVEAMEFFEARMRQRRNLPKNTGITWTKEEDEKLVRGFEAGEPFSVLARDHDRTSGAIEARLIKLGKLPPKEHFAFARN